MLLCLTVAMVRKLRKENSVAYGHWWVPGGLVAVIAAALSRRPSVIHLHGSDAAITATKIRRMAASVVMRLADICVSVSDELAVWGEGISGREFKVLPMPIDLERLPGPSAVPEDGLVLGQDIQALASQSFANERQLQVAKRVMRQAWGHVLGDRPLRSRELLLKHIHKEAHDGQQA